MRIRRAAMTISLERVSSDSEVLRNLAEFWHYDFSDFLGADVTEDGRFGPRGFDHVSEVPGAEAYLLRRDDAIAGFAVVHPDGDGWFIDKFFVLRKFRRAGLGAEAVELLSQMHPGTWSLTVRTPNTAAMEFWRAVLNRLDSDHTEERPRTFDDGVTRVRFRFTGG